jgi:hypothetical protein
MTQATFRHSLRNFSETFSLYSMRQEKGRQGFNMETPTSTVHQTDPSSNGGESTPASFPRPNFPPFRENGFYVDVKGEPDLQEILRLVPLRPFSESGRALPRWELQCRTASDMLAGGCIIALPFGRGDFPSPRQLPHPLLGEWISALRYTGLKWLECGQIAVAPGFSEENVCGILLEGLSRLMKRNDVTFLIGEAATGSLVLDMAIRRGARVLEPFVPSPVRYFLYTE